jgi:hypothetical protein
VLIMAKKKLRIYVFLGKQTFSNKLSLDKCAKLNVVLLFSFNIRPRCLVFSSTFVLYFKISPLCFSQMRLKQSMKIWVPNHGVKPSQVISKPQNSITIVNNYQVAIFSSWFYFVNCQVIAWSIRLAVKYLE